ncbi:MAG: hypothetical protein ACK4U0_21735 [Mesorhizobium sp.]
MTTLLVALAALAERASNRSFPVRWLVLCLLRYAERVARDFVVEETGWEWHVIEDAFGIGDAPDIGAGFDTCHSSRGGPADALALAWRLRVLAALLRTLLPPDDVSGQADTDAGTVDAARSLASRLGRFLAKPLSLAWPTPDTS